MKRKRKGYPTLQAFLSPSKRIFQLSSDAVPAKMMNNNQYVFFFPSITLCNADWTVKSHKLQLMDSLLSLTPTHPPFHCTRPFTSLTLFAPPPHRKLAQTVKKVSALQPRNSGHASLQNGGLGVALLSSITANAKLRISPFVATLAANPTFVSGLLAWLIGQSVKVLLNFFFDRKWDFRLLFASGGMPSSHSALCTALTTSVAICHGVADSLFPVCLGFSLIVMYDAIGVRRHAGMQAQVTASDNSCLITI